MKPRRAPWILTGLVIAITALLWAGAKLGGQQPGFPPFWIAASQLVSLESLALMSIALLAGTRARMLEPFFGGLDGAIRFHRAVGPASVLLLVGHVLLLVIHWLSRGYPILPQVIPFYAPETRTPYVLTFWGLVVLGALAYSRSLKYEPWIWLHRLVGPLFVGSAVHLFVIGSSVRHYEPLRSWIALLVLVGVVAWFYRVVLFRRFGPRYEYEVGDVIHRNGGITDLVMRPVDRRMIYDPGTFVFIALRAAKGVSGELHPFSISSSPVERDLRLSIRRLGDWTRSMEKITPGARATLYGPFGIFTPNAFVKHRRLVLIGAGIGITPFLSMLAFERTNNDFRRIWLYYIVPNADDAAFEPEIRDTYLNTNSYIDYTLWETRKQGHIKARTIVDEVSPFGDYAVMLCGNARFVQGLKQQFQALGVSPDRVIAEEFDFR
ncbi:ferredoxin reductase family protein [Muricoccus radiodurans]|uniref:ferredoxin reductase family protein n=1 Tax=Muricoccus radiodurans TaxID=2231721 RepID=UPI003CEFB89D